MSNHGIISDSGRTVYCFKLGIVSRQYCQDCKDCVPRKRNSDNYLRKKLIKRIMHTNERITAEAAHGGPYGGD